MTIAYFDCFSGISGDMVLGALVDAGLDFDYLREELAKLPVDGYRIEHRTVRKHEIIGTKIDVIIETPGGHDMIEGPGDEDHDSPHDPMHQDHTHNQETDQGHHHGPSRRLRDIIQLIEESALDASIRQQASTVFDHLASAEGITHGMDKNEVHLHEVSGLDAMVDIVGACIGLHRLGIGEAYASALPLGSGFVRCAHGRMPVPAPGALELLRGVPVYQTKTRGELITPTGAAILKTVVKAFGPMPRMILNRVGYGAGTKDFAEHPNLLRLCIGERSEI